MKKKKLKFSIIISIFVFLIIGGAACSNSKAQLGTPERVTLEWWTVFKQTDELQTLIKNYELKYPYVSINVKTLRFDEFENTLLNALAEDRGPDIFTIHNTAVRKYLPKIEPMPPTTTMQVSYIQGTIKKQTFTKSISVNSYSKRDLNTIFLDQVLNDAYVNNQIQGLPLSMDTLVLFYNKSLLNAAGIPLPATTYKELQEQVIKLTKQDELGNIIQSGIAMGTSNNINRYSDILSLLMMQNGTQMTDSFGNVTFDKLPEELKGRTSLPSADALLFYTNFASPSNTLYTWNESKGNALEEFLSGKTAYYFGYAYDVPTIEAQGSKLNYAIAKVPQIPGNTPVNFANYWLETVSNKSKNTDEAWNFIEYITNPKNVAEYLTNAQLPTATKTLVNDQKEDEVLGVFTEQLLTARSWYKGKDPEVVNKIFTQMIDDVKNTTIQIKKILSNGASKINQSIR